LVEFGEDGSCLIKDKKQMSTTNSSNEKLFSIVTLRGTQIRRTPGNWAMATAEFLPESGAFIATVLCSLNQVSRRFFTRPAPESSK
jgi:hypothetical protein